MDWRAAKKWASRSLRALETVEKFTDKVSKGVTVATEILKIVVPKEKAQKAEMAARKAEMAVRKAAMAAPKAEEKEAKEIIKIVVPKEKARMAAMAAPMVLMAAPKAEEKEAKEAAKALERAEKAVAAESVAAAIAAEAAAMQEAKAVLEATVEAEAEARKAAETIVGQGAGMTAELIAIIEAELNATLGVLKEKMEEPLVEAAKLLESLVPTMYCKVFAAVLMMFAAAGIKLVNIAHDFVGLSGSEVGKKVAKEAQEIVDVLLEKVGKLTEDSPSKVEINKETHDSLEKMRQHVDSTKQETEKLIHNLEVLDHLMKEHKVNDIVEELDPVKEEHVELKGGKAGDNDILADENK